MSFIDTHGGLIAVACVIGFFALVGWWSDRRKWKRMMKENAKCAGTDASGKKL